MPTPTERLEARMNELSESLAKISVAVEFIKDELKSDVERLKGTVFIGNGTRSVLSRLQIIEEKLERVEQTIEKVDSSIDKLSVEYYNSQKKFVATIVVGVIFWATLMIDFLYKSDMITYILKLWKG